MGGLRLIASQGADFRFRGGAFIIPEDDKEAITSILAIVGDTLAFCRSNAWRHVSPLQPEADHCVICNLYAIMNGGETRSKMQRPLGFESPKLI